MFKYLRLLLLPFSLLYGLIVELIKSFYKKGYLHAERFEIANIVVGNLSIGGTGKTPQKVWKKSNDSIPDLKW
jgi:tetraacyldisaccharide 4'-kinase